MNNTNLTIKSPNRKTGEIPVSTSSMETCPDACPLKKNGCYAGAGHTFMFWKKVTEKRAGVSYNEFLQKVEALPPGVFWRHNQAGDLEPSADNKEIIDFEKLQGLYYANRDKKGFTFTHYDLLNYNENAAFVKISNQNGFTINASGNNLDHADSLADLDVAPVVSVLPIEYERKTEKNPDAPGKRFSESLEKYKTRLQALPMETPQGRKLVICPATYNESTTCKNCQLCAKVKRKSIVGFPAHGISKKKAQAVFERGAA